MNTPATVNHDLRVVRPFAFLSASATALSSAGLSLVGDRTWTAPELADIARGWCAEWADTSELSRAPLVAFDARVTTVTATAIWTLIELGIPFLPLHPAWTASQRREVVLATGALELSLPTTLPVSHPDSPDLFDVLRRPIVEESILAVVCTSGSSGQPQPARLSHRAFWTSARATQHVFGDSAVRRWYASLPLAHIGGLSVLTRAAVLGSTVVLPPSDPARESPTRAPQPRFDARSFLTHCELHGVTAASLVPTQLQRLVSLGLKAPNSLRLALLGGAPAPTSLVAAAGALDWPVHRTYGLTEACSQVATDQHPGQLSELTLNPQLEARLEPNGRLALRGDTLFSGYWGHSPRDVGEWFVTSDLAALNERGLSILGRADDVVISGGENIHPAEVEAALSAAPGVLAACAFGRPSESWGHELCAALVVSGPEFDAAALVDYLRARLPSFKVPKAWVLVPELPLTASGKVSRRLCRERYAQTCSPLSFKVDYVSPG